MNRALPKLFALVTGFVLCAVTAGMVVLGFPSRATAKGSIIPSGSR